ncbi:MAG: putative Ig domain-containing protein [Blastocatellia bacterium]|nr:putative Ig domain-containing protein [Blastocatellia bacterium]
MSLARMFARSGRALLRRADLSKKLMVVGMVGLLLMLGLIVSGGFVRRFQQVFAEEGVAGIRWVRVAAEIDGEGIAAVPGADSLIFAGDGRGMRLDADGGLTPFRRLAGRQGRIAVVRESGGGFFAGEIFAGTDAIGGIARFTSEGGEMGSPWVTLPGETGLVRGLAMDAARGRLVAVTTRGGIWAIDAAGEATRLAPMVTMNASGGADAEEAPVVLEGLAIAPDDAGRYGPWAGRILASAPNRGAIYSVDADGRVDAFEMGISQINNLLLIPAKENLFGVAIESSGRAAIYGAPAAGFADMTGDLLLTQRGGESCACAPALWRVRWNGAEFEKTQVAELPGAEPGTAWGQAIFTPFGASLIQRLQQTGGVPFVGPTGRPAATGADDLMLQEAVISSINGATAVPASGNELRSLRFINTIFNAGDAPSNFVITAPTIPAGFTVLASGDGGSTFAPLNGGGSVRTSTPLNPRTEERNIDIRLLVPVGTATDRDYDIVVQVTSATDATKFDRTTDRIRITAGAPPPPPLTLTKSVTDENGELVRQGDVLKYALTLKNNQAVAAAKTYIEEYVPANTTYIANSVEITAGANPGPKTDARDADQVDYYAPVAGSHNGQINIGTGAGAGGRDANGMLNGGTLAPAGSAGDSATVTFRVRVNGGLPNGAQIANFAFWGAGDRERVDKSNTVTSTVAAPDPLVGPFDAAAAVGPTNNNDDFTLRRVVLGQSSGLTPRGGQVQFINTLRNSGDAAGRFVISAPVIPAGFSVLASADSGNSFVMLDQTSTAVTPTDVQPFKVNPADAQRNIEIRVIAPAGLTVSTNYDVVIQVCRDDNPAICNRTIDRIRPEPVAPNLELVKGVRDLAGNDLHGKSVQRGQTIEYTLTLTNRSTSAAANSFIAEYLPTGIAYVAGSSGILAGASAGAKTDARGDDQVDYYPIAPPNPNGQINFLVGAGSAAYRGGILAPGESATVAFRAIVDPNAPNGTVINNGATWGAEDFGVGGESNIVTVTVNPPPAPTAVPLLGPFDRPDAVGPTDNNDDFTRLKVFPGNANGQTTSDGRVRFINTLKNIGTLAGRFVISAPTIPAGFSVRVSVDSGATFVSLNQGGTATTPTELNINEARNLDVQVDAPAGLPLNVDADVVLQARLDTTAASAPTNRTIDRVRPDPTPPSLALIKQVRDLSGNDLDKKTAAPGQTLEYVLTLRNNDNKAVVGTFIAEYLPPNATYVANSVQITAGPNAGAKTDRRGDDQVDAYLTAYVNGQINIYTGAGATSDRGGILAAGESVTATFRVTVNGNASLGTIIRNGADWGAEDFGIGGKSNIVETTVANPCTAPQITSQPADRQVCAGTSVRFSAVATGTDLTWQWRKDGVNIPGANGAEYVIVVATQAEVGAYDVVIANACGTVTSNAGRLTLAPFQTITTQPVSQVRETGQSVTFTVAATGDGLRYQWRKNNVNIPGATSPTFTIASVTPGDEGSYDVVVTGGCGSLPSAVATLKVNPPPCPSIRIGPDAAALPAGVIGTAYSTTFTQSGGTAPVVFSVSAGALPPGLTLNSATGALTGKPTTEGSFAFTIQATDARNCTGAQAYTLVVGKTDPDACRLTICFHSANYFSLNWGTSNIPSGSLLIGGVNFGNPVNSRDSRVKQALDGQFGQLNRQYVAAQLSVLGASGLGAANIATALQSELRCYGLDFDPVALTGGAAYTPETKLFALFLNVTDAVRGGATSRDLCILTKLLAALNGDNPANVCNRATGRLDFTLCN